MQRRKAALLVQQHAVSVTSMVPVEHASLEGAPPMLNRDLRIAPNMAVAKSRAPWQAAPPTPNARVSAPNTAVVQANVRLAAAPTRRGEACGRPAQRRKREGKGQSFSSLPYCPRVHVLLLACVL